MRDPRDPLTGTPTDMAQDGVSSLDRWDADKGGVRVEVNTGRRIAARSGTLVVAGHLSTLLLGGKELGGVMNRRRSLSLHELE